MNIVGYIVIGLVILFVVLVYFAFLFMYIGYSKCYREAPEGIGTIVEVMDDVKFATGMHAPGVVRHRRFKKYSVSIWVNGQQYIKEADLKNKKFQVGQQVKLRFDFNKKGELEFLSQAYLCWVREMALGYTGGIILAVVCLILKQKGII